MKKPLWVVQSNLGKEDDLVAMRAAFGSIGLQHLEVKVIPFSDELPDVPTDRPCIFYGATGFVYKAWKSGRWQPCAFFDEEKFRFSHWRKAWSGRLMNEEAETLTLGEFAGSSRPPDSLWFLRPDRDNKAFAGEVIAFSDVKEWADKLSAGGFTFGTDEPIVVAEPRNIHREWRLFMVDGRASSASQYRDGRRLAVSAGAPAVVRTFAEVRAREFAPARAFVLDVGEVSNGDLKIIEANCINSAGFYAADIEKIIRDVTATVDAQGEDR